VKYTKAEAKEYAKATLQGIFSAFCLPENGDGEIDESGLRHDIQHYLNVIKSGGLYVHGFYGNFWLLTIAERKRVMEIVAEEAGGKLPIICRCAHQSLKETIGLIQHAEAHGADFISLIGPAFGAASESMIYEYFERVAASTNLGLSIFNTSQAGYVISPQLMARLADIPNVCALKNAVAMSHTIQVRKLVGDSIVVVDPSEENFLISLTQFGQHRDQLHVRQRCRHTHEGLCSGSAGREYRPGGRTLLRHAADPRPAPPLGEGAVGCLWRLSGRSDQVLDPATRFDRRSSPAAASAICGRAGGTTARRNGGPESDSPIPAGRVGNSLGRRCRMPRYRLAAESRS